MNVLLVTSWGQKQCGIQAHSELLIAEMEKTDDIHITPNADLLNPHAVFKTGKPNVLHLNYHRALHSRWTPEEIRLWKKADIKVVITFHDTFGEHPPDDLSRELCDLADAFIVHEPCVGLEKAHYWRMAVPEFSGRREYRTGVWEERPMLGTIGFNFPWKNWPRLAEVARAVGWGFCICTPAMTDEDEKVLRTLNPWLDVRRDLPTSAAIDTLHECDATAFTNVCANSGQSAAILYGIAARKPVVALGTCRQYRGLYQDALGHWAIHWADTFEHAGTILRHLPFGRFYAPTVALAEQDSWEQLGKKYTALYRKLVA